MNMIGFVLLVLMLAAIDGILAILVPSFGAWLAWCLLLDGVAYATVRAGGRR